MARFELQDLEQARKFVGDLADTEWGRGQLAKRICALASKLVRCQQSCIGEGLSSDATKAQESAWIEAVASSVPAGCYLTHLFTPEMLGWVSDCLKEDAYPDLFEFFQQFRKAHAQRRALEVSEETQFLNIREEQLLVDLADSESREEEMRDEIRDLLDQCDVLDLELSYCQKIKSEVALQILQLKAALYDYMQKERSEVDES